MWNYFLDFNLSTTSHNMFTMRPDPLLSGLPSHDVCEQWRSQFEMDASRFVLEGSTKEPDETETSFRRRVCEGVSCCRCVVSLCLQNPPHWLLLIWRIDKKYIFGLGGNNRRSKYQPTMNFCLWESIFCTSKHGSARGEDLNEKAVVGVGVFTVSQPEYFSGKLNKGSQFSPAGETPPQCSQDPCGDPSHSLRLNSDPPLAKRQNDPRPPSGEGRLTYKVL